MKSLLPVLIVFLFVSCSKKNEIVKEPLTPAPIETGPLKTSSFINNMRITFNDDFKGTSFDESKWSYRANNTVRQLATVSGAKTISLDGNGNLIIKAVKDTDGKYYVGQLSTDGKFLQKYGYFECRVKLQKSIGMHSAFWLQSSTFSSRADNPFAAGAEIDIFEYIKPEPTTTYHTVHWGGYGATAKSSGKIHTSPTINDGNFHTFGLLWTTAEYIFFVDGTEVARVDKGLSGVEQYMILSTELTGWGGDPALGVFPDEVVFDYVKVYKYK